VTTALVVAVAVAGLVLAAACAVEAIRDRPAGIPLLAVAVAAELVLLVAVGASVVALARGHDPASTATTIGYLVGVPFVLPFAAVVALAERSRWGSVVLGAGGLVLAVLAARLGQVWQPAAATLGL
jgi:hypothetical protein